MISVLRRGALGYKQTQRGRWLRGYSEDLEKSRLLNAGRERRHLEA